eukprot:CAMPEP_0204085882 /NCGR_PEP_ID=MMETSP0360-20130528/182256_1 /ASSEMBLY_ACC=CAM_ASM_000342 /TAXON_ID=268821 /ORGANISM="Scrippsiella Hangoei, Strain SHTV-5" /LENGTH=71 /DNA_ID=CAMNT_0051034957 /DNA_START=57 /DNA_END=269 /DNA_ORIENTATION=+
MHVLLDLLLSCNSGDALLATPLICRDQLVASRFSGGSPESQPLMNLRPSECRGHAAPPLPVGVARQPLAAA